MISITFQFEDGADTAHALMVMNEIFEHRQTLSSSASDLLGFIADMFLECADDFVVYGDKEKNRYAANAFRNLADALNENSGAAESAVKKESDHPAV